jgi:hypothetical protein
MSAEQLKDEHILEKLFSSWIRNGKFLILERRRGKAKEWLEFDNGRLICKRARVCQFDEGDIAQIVSDFRGGRYALSSIRMC